MDKIMVGKRLKSMRAESGKTTEEVAWDNGISCSALNMYENGNRIPRDEIKERLAHYYGRSVSSIFFD